MKFSFSAIAFAASLAFVNAQDLTGIPTCALTCFATAAPGAGCDLTDTTCQCTTGKDKIAAQITSCVPTKCSAEEIAQLAPAVSAICARAGVTLTDIPTATPSVSGGASGTPTASVTTTASGSTKSTGAAVANMANLGAVALGAAAMWL